MKYSIVLSTKESFTLECKVSVVNSTLILSSNKSMLAAFAPGNWQRVERIDLDDIIANSTATDEIE